MSGRDWSVGFVVMGLVRAAGFGLRPGGGEGEFEGFLYGEEAIDGGGLAAKGWMRVEG